MLTLALEQIFLFSVLAFAAYRFYKSQKKTLIASTAQAQAAYDQLDKLRASIIDLASRALADIEAREQLACNRLDGLAKTHTEVMRGLLNASTKKLDVEVCANCKQASLRFFYHKATGDPICAACNSAEYLEQSAT
jgi:hypothetical protein